MTDSRNLFVGIQVLALVSLGACGGKATSDSSERAGASAGGGGVTAGPMMSGFGGAQPQPVCCNFVFDCDSGDETLSDSVECPNGATCYSREGCCGYVTHCAHFEAPPMFDAGAPSDGGTCSLLGEWKAYSAPWNGKSTDAEISFLSDGFLKGTPSFTGSWFLTGSTLTIQNTVGPDMTCSFPDHWTLTFSDDCQTAPLLPIDSGCTGARRYLDWNVTLTRVPAR
jgi:hypothetical protein